MQQAAHKTIARAYWAGCGQASWARIATARCTTVAVVSGRGHYAEPEADHVKIWRRCGILAHQRWWSRPDGSEAGNVGGKT